MFSQLLLNCTKVHRILHHAWVIGDLQFYIVDGICENVSFLVTVQSCKHALSRFFPLIVDWGALWYFRHLQLTDWLLILLIIIELKVLCNLWIHSLELFEFLISHGRIITTFSQSCEKIAFWNLALIHHRFYLWLCCNLLLWLTIVVLILFSRVTQLATSIEK